MAEISFDALERQQLCELFLELGPDVPTLLEPWSTRDLAAHLVLREHDYLAAPGLVVPGPWHRLAARRTAKLAVGDFASLVNRISSGPPPGFFRIGWVRRFPNLNEFFVHHEDVRRANGRGPWSNAPDLDAALWHNVAARLGFLPGVYAARDSSSSGRGQTRECEPGEANRGLGSSDRPANSCCISSDDKPQPTSRSQASPPPLPPFARHRSVCERMARS